MLEFVGNALIAFIEKEIIKHEPEIQAMMIDQLSKLSDIIVQFITQRMQAESEHPMLEHESNEEKE